MEKIQYFQQLLNINRKRKSLHAYQLMIGTKGVKESDGTFRLKCNIVAWQKKLEQLFPMEVYFR